MMATLRDWLPALAPIISFFAALMGAWLGATLAGRNERRRLFREQRLNALASLLENSRSMVMWGVSWARLYPRVSAGADARTNADYDHAVGKRDEAATAAWSAYYRARLLGPASLATAVEDYWQAVSALLVGPITTASIEADTGKLLAAEKTLYSAVIAELRK